MLLTLRSLWEKQAPIQSPADQKREEIETMVEAHEALSEAAPENVLRFKDVLDFLRQDLHQVAPETLHLPPKQLDKPA